VADAGQAVQRDGGVGRAQFLRRDHRVARADHDTHGAGRARQSGADRQRRGVVAEQVRCQRAQGCAAIARPRRQRRGQGRRVCNQRRHRLRRHRRAERVDEPRGAMPRQGEREHRVPPPARRQFPPRPRTLPRAKQIADTRLGRAFVLIARAISAFY